MPNIPTIISKSVYLLNMIKKYNFRWNPSQHIPCVPTCYQPITNLKYPQTIQTPKRSFFNLFEKKFRPKLWFPYTNPPRTCKEWQNELCPASIFHAGRCPSKTFWKIDQKRSFFNLFDKFFRPTNCDFLTLTHPGHGKNDKTNFARPHFFTLAGARIRFFEKLTKNTHFSTFLKRFFATNCDFLTLTHPGQGKNDITNFAWPHFFMLAVARIRFFEKLTFLKKIFATSCDFLYTNQPRTW